MKNTHNSMFYKDHFYYNWSVLYQTAIAICNVAWFMQINSCDPVIFHKISFVIISHLIEGKCWEAMRDVYFKDHVCLINKQFFTLSLCD